MDISLDEWMCKQIIEKLEEVPELEGRLYKSPLWDAYIVDQAFLSSTAYQCLLTVSPSDSLGAEGMRDNPSPVQYRNYMIMCYGYENAGQIPERFASTEAYMRYLLDIAENALTYFQFRTPSGKKLMSVNLVPRTGNRMKFAVASTTDGELIKGLKVLAMEYSCNLNIKLIEQ